jgi:hypothetical protein
LSLAAGFESESNARLLPFKLWLDAAMDLDLFGGVMVDVVLLPLVLIIACSSLQYENKPKADNKDCPKKCIILLKSALF